MQRLTRILISVTSLLVFGAVAQAQWGRPGGPWQPDSVSALIDHVHDDLNRGYNVWHLSHGDRDRLDHAEHQLRDFARKWREGRFDHGQLDGAIGNIQRILDRNHLRGGERDALWAEVSRLREMRAAYDRHEIGRW
jgi:hypothetical protein